MSGAEDAPGVAPSSALVHDASSAAAAAAAAVRAAQQELAEDGDDEGMFFDPPQMPTVLSDPGPGRR